MNRAIAFESGFLSGVLSLAGGMLLGGVALCATAAGARLRGGCGGCAALVLARFAAGAQKARGGAVMLHGAGQKFAFRMCAFFMAARNSARFLPVPLH